MIRFSCFRQNTASIFRVTNVQVGSEVLLRMKYVSCLAY